MKEIDLVELTLCEVFFYATKYSLHTQKVYIFFDLFLLKVDPTTPLVFPNYPT